MGYNDASNGNSERLVVIPSFEVEQNQDPWHRLRLSHGGLQREMVRESRQINYTVIAGQAQVEGMRHVFPSNDVYSNLAEEFLSNK